MVNIYYINKLRKLESNHTSIDQRRAARETCLIKTMIEGESNEPTLSWLVDISESGARIKTDRYFEINEIVNLVGFKLRQKVPCAIVWQKEDLVGLKFCQVATPAITPRPHNQNIQGYLPKIITGFQDPLEHSYVSPSR